jgi:ADP-ribose pyrophosphatase YjhB (NUDIX family)
MLKNRFKIIPGVYVILKKGDEVLLLRRFNTGFADGMYTLPGGHLDKGESYLQAAIRETREETAVMLKPEDVHFVHVLHRKEDGDRIDLIFTVEKWIGEPRIAESNKCDDVRWFLVDNLPDNIIPYIRQIIKKTNKKISYSDFGF